MSANSSNLDYCNGSKAVLYIFSSIFVVSILLVPLFFLVLYLGLQRSRKQRSAMSPSDFFTCNIAALELISTLGSCIKGAGAYKDDQTLQDVGSSIFSLTTPGQTLLHLLTCVERYMAVVHPIAYLGLRQTSGVTIRNTTTGCVWLLCTALTQLRGVFSHLVANSCLVIFSSVVITFCSLSVLLALKHPKPGEVSEAKVDLSKQKAFCTIMAIMIAEVFRLMGILVFYVLFALPALTDAKCAVGSSAMWFTIPCSLVMPLLFLKKGGKLPDCKRYVKSG